MSSLTITIIQADLFWEDKARNLSMFESKIRSIEEKTHLVLLPEMFSTGFSMNAVEMAETMDGATIGWMRKISAEKKVILVGSLIIQENNNYFNRLLWMQPNGLYGYYDKRHLFAFAGEDIRYSRGKNRLITSVNGWKINCQICYDLRFPVWSRQQTQKANGEPEFDMLIYVANWPSKRSHAWKSLLVARAIENQCYVIGINRVGRDNKEIYHSGDSMVVDPMGEILYIQTDKEDIHTLNFQKEMIDNIRKSLPFLKDADDFDILM